MMSMFKKSNLINQDVVDLLVLCLDANNKVKRRYMNRMFFFEILGTIKISSQANNFYE
jgi:hypothetical protein